MGGCGPIYYGSLGRAAEQAHGVTSCRGTDLLVGTVLLAHAVVR